MLNTSGLQTKWFFSFVVLLLLNSAISSIIQPNPVEFALRDAAVSAMFPGTRRDNTCDARSIETAVQSRLAFSFIYNGKTSNEIFKKWKCQTSSRRLDSNRSQHVIAYSDLVTGLSVQCIVVTYDDFPILEWCVHFENSGPADTPVLGHIFGADLLVKCSAGSNDSDECVLRYNRALS